MAPDADPDQLEVLTAGLRRELVELDQVEVERAGAGVAPDGARSGELAELATLVVSVTTAPAALGAVVATIRAWLGYQAKREVTIERDGKRVHITGRPTQDDRELIERLLADA